MKRSLFTLFLLCCVVCGWAQTNIRLAKPRLIKQPVIEYSPSWMNIQSIELTKEATVVRGFLCNKPNYWCQVTEDIVLKDRNSDKQFKILRAEGFRLNEQVVMPQSGRVPITMYFEPLHADVKELNCIEPKAHPRSGVYGIQLVSQRKAGKRDKGFDPERLTKEYYLQQRFLPDALWRFDNERYKSPEAAPFISGKAVLRVHMANVPKELSATLGTALISVESQLTKEEKNQSAPFDAANSCWTFHLDLPYPQWVSGFHIGNIFIQPGDTLDVFSTLATNDHRQPLYTTFRSSSESALINTFAHDIVKRYNQSRYDKQAFMRATAMGRDSAMSVLNGLAGEAIDILENDALRQELNQTPLSTFGKDVVMMSAVAQKVCELEDAVITYDDRKFKRVQKEDGTSELHVDSTFQPLDYQKVYGPLMPYKSLIYDNPLALCEASQWVFVNRSIYSKAILYYERDKDAQGNEVVERKDLFDMKGTFMYDIYLAQDFANLLRFKVKSLALSNKSEEIRTSLDYVESQAAATIKDITSPVVARTVLHSYRQFVRTTEGGAQREDSHWTAEQRALWDRLFGKYKGNLLLIDFWGLGCGPCRAGMVRMRDKVEALKDETIKFIYIAATDGETTTSRSEEWMRKNEIKGEHLFISPSDWAMLESMLSFTSIPRYVLAGPDGRLLQNSFEMHLYDVEGFKGLVKKFVR